MSTGARGAKGSPRGTSLATAAPIEPGQWIAGKYRVERVLGRGGMGVVLAATHVDLHELRAIKLLHDPGSAADAVDRFLREARAAAKLKSERVAKVFDVGRLEDGSPYLVMEYLEGCDLGALLKARGPLPVEEAAYYLLQALEGMAEAHAAGIIHRDLKPANLFLTTAPDGTAAVKVLDFGISKLAASGGVSEDMTRTDTVLGSPFYMSPEQMRSTRDVDARTDIWSFGVILYRLLTAVVPFQGDSITQVCAAVVGDVPALPSSRKPGLDPRADAVVMRCLEKDPARRFADVGELAAALAPLGPPGSELSLERTRRMLRGAEWRSGANPALGLGAPLGPSVDQLPPAGTASSWSTTSAHRGGRTSRAVIVAVALLAVLAGAAIAAGLLLSRRADPGADGPGNAALGPGTTASNAPTGQGSSAAATSQSPSATSAPVVPSSVPSSNATTAATGVASTGSSAPSSSVSPGAKPRPTSRPTAPSDPFGSGRN